MDAVGLVGNRDIRQIDIVLEGLDADGTDIAGKGQVRQTLAVGKNIVADLLETASELDSLQI